MKKIALINDMSGFGKCSLVAAIPVISVMGIQPCPLPTAVLSCQTEFEDYYCCDLTEKMDFITDGWHKMNASFDGIYSGYLATTLQIDKIMHFLDVFHKEGTLYLADPVMGDDGAVYDMFNNGFLEQMKALTARADVITPNLTELCLLADVDYREFVKHRSEDDYIQRIKDICHRLLKKAKRPQTIIVTGIISEKDGAAYIGNLEVTEQDEYYVSNSYTGKSFSGTGDLFASVICGSLVKGLTAKEAMDKAMYFLGDAILEATRENVPVNEGVYFEKYLARLL